MNTELTYQLIDAKNDDETRKVIIEYIRANFADVLGNDVLLLNTPNGLDIIAEKYRFNSKLKTKPQTEQTGETRKLAA